MRVKKRFANHDLEVQLTTQPDRRVIKARLSCRRCPATAEVEAGPDAPYPLYRGLELMEDQPCALATLDERGLPQPVG